ncbi:MAG: peptidase M48, partial [Mariprofundaceae bacterium]
GSLMQAAKALSAIPKRLRNFAHDPYTARAICYALLLDENKAQRRTQMTLLQQVADPNVYGEMLAIQSDVQGLPVDLRLPLLEMSFPALKSLSLTQYKVFVKCVSMLIKANHQMSLFEYTLHRMLRRHLRPVFFEVKASKVRYQNIREVSADCGCVLAMLIDFGMHENPKALFSKVSLALLGEAMPWPPARILHISRLDKALNKLDESCLNIKQAILKACVAVVLDDGQIHVKEAQALRAIADSLGCPAPSL